MQTAGLGDVPVPSPAPGGVLVPSPAPCRGGCGSWGPVGCPPPSPGVPQWLQLCDAPGSVPGRSSGAHPGAGCPVTPWDGSLVPRPDGKARVLVEPCDAGSAGLQLQQCKMSGVKWGCGSRVGAAEPTQEQHVPRGPALVSPHRPGMPCSPRPWRKVTAFPRAPCLRLQLAAREGLKKKARKQTKTQGKTQTKLAAEPVKHAGSLQISAQLPRPRNLPAAASQPGTRCSAPAPRGDFAWREEISDVSSAVGGCRRGRRSTKISYDGHKLNFNRDVGGSEPARSGSGKVVIKS